MGCFLGRQPRGITRDRPAEGHNAVINFDAHLRFGNSSVPFELAQDSCYI